MSGCSHNCPMFQGDVATRLLQDIGEIKGDVKAIRGEIYGNGKTGLIKKIEQMQTHCEYKHVDVDNSFILLKDQMKAPAATVSTWRERAIGAGMLLGSLGGVTALAVYLTKLFAR